MKTIVKPAYFDGSGTFQPSFLQKITDQIISRPVIQTEKAASAQLLQNTPSYYDGRK